MRIIGLDIHRVAAEAVALHDGAFRKLGRIPMLREALEDFARKNLTHDDHVVIEATGNAASVAELLAPHVDRVVIANPKQVRMIAHAKIKTDAIDAAGRYRAACHARPADPAVDDAARRRHDRRFRRRSSCGRHQALRCPAKASGVSRSEPERQAIRRRAGIPWPDHQTGARTGTRDAR